MDQINKAIKAKILNDLLGLDYNYKFEKIVEKYIYETAPSIDCIAREMSMSISSLERWVKKTYALSPKKYIINKKLDTAHQILITKNESVKNVAYLLGFNSVSYFCLCYKKKFGNSPKASSEYK